MSYITTVTGKHFDPVSPDPELIDVFDIAHALSMICRANGHVRRFYSVAQHSIACAKEAQARGWSREIVLGCLFHDGSEAYLSDVTRPVKKDLPYYLEVEDRLQNLIWERFIGRPITQEERRAVFEIDDAMLSMEFPRLMPDDCGDEYQNLTREVICEEASPASVRDEFIRLAASVGTKCYMQERVDEGARLAASLLASPKYSFSELKPSELPKDPGVYAIFHKATGETLYVGRTTEIRKRIKQHIGGPENSARLKKYLVNDDRLPEIVNMKKAKDYMMENCYFQFVTAEEPKQRGRIEGLLSYLLKVRYIETEH